MGSQSRPLCLDRPNIGITGSVQFTPLAVHRWHTLYFCTLYREDDIVSLMMDQQCDCSDQTSYIMMLLEIERGH